MSDYIKPPPHSNESEQAVLGALMRWAGSYDEIAGTITADDFYFHKHKLIFRAIDTLAGANVAHDALVVSERLEKQGDLDDAGGLAYVGTLANNVPSAANIRAYAEIVANRALERRLIAAANEAASVAYGPGDTESKIAAVQNLFGEAIDSAVKDADPVDVKTLINRALNEIDRKSQMKESDGVTGLTTGLADLDDRTQGLQAGDLVIIAGRPSMGKTTLATGFGRHAALVEGKPVLLFSLEMSNDRIMNREISALSLIDHYKTRSGKLAEDDWPKLTRAAAQLSEAKIWIDDTPGLNLTQLRAKARRMKRKHGIELIVIDYLQLMTAEGRTRDEEVSGITRGLKNLARELHLPIIALSQLNRSLESRPNKRPRLSDLRESGAIEQDADVIMFVYRDEVYNEDTIHKGLAEIIIGKNRDGEIGTVHASFDGRHCRFENFEGDWPREQATTRRQKGFGNPHAEQAAAG